MSTKLSTDLHITRPTTRLHAPPGGATTITFGECEPPAPPQRNNRHVQGGKSTFSLGNEAEAAAAKTAEEPVAEAVKAPAEPKLEVVSVQPNASHSVALVVAGSVGVDATVLATVKALTKKGISSDHVAITQLADYSILPYVVKRIAQGSFKVIIAVAILTGDQADVQNQTLANTLVQLGLSGDVAVIPGIVYRDNLLEIKALLPTFASSWAASASFLLQPLEFHVTPEPMVVAAPLATKFDAETTSVDVLLDVFRESLKKRGASGIAGLARKFRIADDSGDGKICLSEFRKVISEHALGWSPTQEKAVFDFFDKDKSGDINYDEFLFGVRGQLNERRRQLVFLAFEILDADKSGIVEINDIMAKYDGTKHPDVIAGKRTNEEVLREFMETFDLDKNGKIPFTEFCEYYGNVSSSIDDDDYFELMIRNAWHISGGEGWCANSSCRRVLVTHNDGRQTVEEIKNDIGMKANDKEAMKANLVAQGINDIKSIDTTGNTDGESPPEDSAGGAKAAATSAPSPVRPSTGRRAPGGASSLVLG